MDPVTMATIGGAILGIGGAAFSEWWAGADDNKREALQRQAQQIYANMSPPDLERLKAEQMGPSAFEGLQTDFGNKGARNAALQRMIDMGLQGGMDEGSVLALEQARRAGAAQAQQGQAAARQEFARRGLGGAGEAVAAQQAQQAGAQNASLLGLQSAADARSRALQALAQGGGMAQQAESADYAQAANRAAAMDRIAQFNANVRQDTNVYNSGLQQQDFQNRMGIADRQYGAARARAGDYETEAERKRRIVGGVGQTILEPIQNYAAGGKK